MIQAKDGIRLTHIGMLAGTAAYLTLLCGCSQMDPDAATRKVAVGTPAQNTNMEEVVITASREHAPRG